MEEKYWESVKEILLTTGCLEAEPMAFNGLKYDIGSKEFILDKLGIDVILRLFNNDRISVQVKMGSYDNLLYARSLNRMSFQIGSELSIQQYSNDHTIPCAQYLLTGYVSKDSSRVLYYALINWYWLIERYHHDKSIFNIPDNNHKTQERFYWMHQYRLLSSNTIVRDNNGQKIFRGLPNNFFDEDFLQDQKI